MGTSFIADRARLALSQESVGAKALERFLSTCREARSGHVPPFLGRRQAATPGLNAAREEMHRAVDALPWDWEQNEGFAVRE